MFKVDIVADSINSFGQRLTSIQITKPRNILAEFNTHREFSRNSASSRAIPFNKMVEAVMSNPFVPMKWMQEHSGMQGTKFFTSGTGDLEDNWLRARDAAVIRATELSQRGLTKQMCNRLLEPFMYHTVLVSATEWENFFAQRVSPAAEIHMEAIATMMLNAMNFSEPKKLLPGEWHIPYYDKIMADMGETISNDMIKGVEAPRYVQEASRQAPSFDTTVGKLILVKIGTMMAARTSYTVPDKELSQWTPSAYCDKHDDLKDKKHWSPFEHCAQCPYEEEYYSQYRGEVSFNGIEVKGKKYIRIIKDIPIDDPNVFGWWGNFHGFKQYRKMFWNERSGDKRLLKKTYSLN